MNASRFSRRGFLGGLAGVAGAAIGTRIAGRSWMGEALAAPTSEPTSLVMVQLGGGYNSIFGSADSLVGKFGVAGANSYDLLPGGSAFDKSLSVAFSPFARTH